MAASSTSAGLCCLKWLKSRNDGDLLDVAASDDFAQDFIRDEGVKADLNQAKLTHKERIVMELHLFEGLGEGDIGERLQRNVLTVRTELQRGKQKLRRVQSKKNS